MDHDVETNTLGDLDNRPLKKARCCESGVLDDLPSVSASSLVSETCSESDDHIDGDPLPSPPSTTKSTVSELANEEKDSDDASETIGSESADHIDGDPLLSPPSTTKSTVSELTNEDDKPLDEPNHTNDVIYELADEEKTDVIYDYLPRDYALTELDLCAHLVIEDSSEKEILVQIDQVYVKQCDLKCLLDSAKWLNDDVISAYIYCIKEVHEQNKNGHKVYFENTFLAGLLKRDGEIGIHEATFMTNIVGNYLKHDMVHLPINIKHSHWYLACVNVEKSEIQVLDSLCWEHKRVDLTNTLQGLQYHLDILKTQENLCNHNWKNLDVTKWTITEQLHSPIQKDSSSCGLFMLKFMEYWTGHTLSHHITQEIIIEFRYKLAAILMCWKTNTAQASATIEESDYSEGDPNDVVMFECIDENQSNTLNSVSIEKKYQSLITVLSNMSVHELEGGLCNYIKSINSAETLEKVWVQSSGPYPISLTLKRLQGMLNEKLPMERDCFNLVVRKIMFDDIQTAKKTKGLISKHYLDMRFWMITDFGRHPNFRKKLDLEQLAYSVCSWPGIKYNVSSCKTVRPLPYTCQHIFLYQYIKLELPYVPIPPDRASATPPGA